MSNGGGVRERRDVWTLSRQDEWHDDILWYERGVAALKKIEDVSDPRSWMNLANIHGTFTARREWPAGSNDRTWNQCQHGGWYFLPWHRVYLHHFEKIVRAAIEELDGPAAWSLPFWNYDLANPESLSLPPAFRQPRTSAGGRERVNALYVKRRVPEMNDGAPLDEGDAEMPRWVRRFAAREAGVTSFGGIKSGWDHMGWGHGQVEIEPHGPVHMAIGGYIDDPERGGLMSFPQLAAQDPIFWLHHANIDRLWEEWRGDGGRDSKDRDWLDERFTMGTGAWETKMRVRDVLDTTAPPLSYRYEGVAPAEPRLRRVAVAAEGGPSDDEDVVPELVSASDTAVPVAERRTVRATRRRQRALRAAADDRAGRRVHLALENVVASRGAATRYAVHVNLPEGSEPHEHRELRAGRISTFGLDEYSRSEAGHEGGATFTFDITEIVERLEARGDWDADDVRVTVTPRGQSGPRAGDALQIGRIGVYYA